MDTGARAYLSNHRATKQALRLAAVKFDFDAPPAPVPPPPQPQQLSREERAAAARPGTRSLGPVRGSSTEKLMWGKKMGGVLGDF